MENTFTAADARILSDRTQLDDAIDLALDIIKRRASSTDLNYVERHTCVLGGYPWNGISENSWLQAKFRMGMLGFHVSLIWSTDYTLSGNKTLISWYPDSHKE